MKMDMKYEGLNEKNYSIYPFAICYTYISMFKHRQIGLADGEVVC